MGELLRRMRYWLDGRRERAELEEEMRLHVALRAEKLERGGLTRAEAEAEARRGFGNELRLEEDSRAMWVGRWLDELMRDARIGARGFARNPGFTAVAVLTLALGIGATTGIFSVVKAVLLEPLAYRDADRIVAVQTLWTKTNRAGNVSGGDYPDLMAEPSPFAAATRYTGGELGVEMAGRAEFVATYGVDAGFNDVFQLKPAAGRLISRDEFQSKAPVAVVSEGLAVSRFGGAREAVGQTVRFEERALTVVGVLPAGFHFPLKAELWVPVFWENQNRTAGNYKAVALLKRGVRVEAARAHLAAVGARLAQAFPGTHKEKSFTARPLKELLVERSRTTLWLLMAAVGLVLLVACANVANLLLARGTARSREMALRVALGAGRGRLFRQMVVESGLLGVAGGGAGLLVAYAGLGVFLRLAPAGLARLDEVRMDPEALAFNVAVSLGAAMVFGVWPAWRAARGGVDEALKQGGARSVLGGGRGEWVRGALVSAEVALALVLTLGAGLLFRSLLALNSVELGYQTAGRLVLTASIPARTEADYLRAGATFARIFEKLREIPGVTGAAGVMGLPTGPYGSNGLFAVEGIHDPKTTPAERLPQAGFRLTSPGYFAAMGVPLVAGRDFDERDVYEAEPVAIVSAALARQILPGQSPLGRRVKCGLERDVWMKIVGVVGDMRNDGPAAAPGAELYMPYRQQPYHANELHIVVRAQGDVARSATAAIAGVNASIPLKVATMEEFQADAVALPRFRTLLLLVFAGIATVLATAGVYGVMSYAAAQRQGEMGLRMALGATAGDVVGILVRSGMKLAGVGLAAGLAVALVAGRFVESMLFGVKPRDPVVVLGAAAVLGLAAVLAALGPAVRVGRVGVGRVLRGE